MRRFSLITLLVGNLFMHPRAWGESIVVPLKHMPTTLDPQHYEDIYSMVVILQVHRGLLRFLPNLEIAPDIAESYKVMEQGKRIVFNLGNRYFSNGVRIEAKHVVRTFQRLFKEKGGFAADINYIKGAKSILNGERDLSILGVKEVNKNTVEFLLEKPVAIFFSHLATVDLAILPLTSDLQFDWKKDPGAGPYLIREKSEETIKLVARKDMLKPQMLEEVILKRMSEADALAEALKGNIDSLDGYAVTKEQLDQIKGKEWRESVTTLTRQIFMSINPKKVDSDTRKTINDILWQTDFTFTSSSYIRAWGLIPSGLSGSFEKSPFKPKEIKPLRRKKSIRLSIVNAEPMIASIAAQIKVALAKYQIEVSIVEISVGTYLKKVKDHDFDLIFRSKFLDYPDGMSILTYFRSNYPSNTFFVHDKEVDRLLDLSIGELNQDRRVSLYKEIQNTILKHGTVIPLVFGSDNQGLWSPKILEVPAHPLGIQGLPFETLKVRQVK